MHYCYLYSVQLLYQDVYWTLFRQCLTVFEVSNADNGVTVLVMRYLDKFERWYITKFDYKNVQHTFV